MPSRWDSFEGAYRVSCTACGTSVLTQHPLSTRHPHDRDARTREGALVSETFRFHSTGMRFFSQCRTCSNERAAARRTANAASIRERIGRALGLERKFGVELELIFPSSVGRYNLAQALEEAGVSGWVVKDDASLQAGRGRTGWEIASPVLRGQAGLDALEKVCRVVAEMGATVNRTCGLHVHHDVGDLNIDALKNIAQGWFDNQQLTDGLVAESRREGGSFYCRPLDEYDIRRIMRCNTVEEMRSGGFEKYRTLNYQAFARLGTIEFRQHQGTMSFEKIRSWIMLGKAVIDTAVATDAATPQKTRVRDLLAAFGDRLDETAKTFLLGRAVEFGHAAV